MTVPRDGQAVALPSQCPLSVVPRPRVACTCFERGGGSRHPSLQLGRSTHSRCTRTGHAPSSLPGHTAALTCPDQQIQLVVPPLQRRRHVSLTLCSQYTSKVEKPGYVCVCSCFLEPAAGGGGAALGPCPCSPDPLWHNVLLHFLERSPTHVSARPPGMLPGRDTTASHPKSVI